VKNDEAAASQSPIHTTPGDDLQALCDASLALARLQGTDDLSSALLHHLERLAPNDYAALLLLNSDGETLSPFAVKSVAERAPRLRSFELRVGVGVTGSVAQTGEALRLGDVTADPRCLAVPPGVRSEMCVPLKLDGQVIGVWDVKSVQPDAYAPGDEARLTALAEIAAVAIHNARVFADLSRKGDELSRLSARVLDLQEEERRRLARELHDEIGQALTAVKIDLQGLLQEVGEPAARLEESVALVERALQQVRSMSLDLRPSLLDDLGLVVALRSHLEQVAERSGLEATFYVEPSDLRLSPELETVCFRIAQEALRNVVRHAQADHVQVAVSQAPTGVQMLVRDDGVGFDVAAALARAAAGSSLGLLSMQERATLAAGRLEIVSAPGQGAQVLVEFPADAVQQDEVG
jgi:signal transduction histidine kinase